jgi:diketogulonate reductase-like aldo/keto reductase
MSKGMDAFRLPSGAAASRLGQGAWQIGDDRRKRTEELLALNVGLDLGLNLIDTAEMYGNGHSEELVAEVVTGRREQIYLVSKVLPENASRRGTITACERSLKRLKTDYLDLYLLHWRGSVPLEETLEAFTRLKERGSIRHYGVSNFDRDDLDEAAALPGGGDIAIAWLLRQPDVVVIPKASSESHVRDNHAALALALTGDDLAEIDRTFPPPQRATPLAMI